MEKILIYENGVVNEYELLYDQDEMKICLEEYKRKFSYLRNGSLYIDCDSCSEKSLLRHFKCYDEVISFRTLIDEDSSYVSVFYVGRINPVVYGILVDKNKKFSLDNKKMYSILSWCEAINYEGSKEEIEPRILKVRDYENLEESLEVENNISTLLSKISLDKVGERCMPSSYEIFYAKKGTEFVRRFNINMTQEKKLVK